jgi:hypothetical protein
MFEPAHEEKVAVIVVKNIPMVLLVELVQQPVPRHPAFQLTQTG